MNSSNSYLTCEVTGPCTISFYAKISSESNFDKGYFYIDDTEKFEISGSQDWTEYSYELGEGTHTLQWRYSKDSGEFSGYDLFYVDNITIPGSSVSSWNEYTATEQSYTFSGLTPEKSYQVKVKGNYGTDGYSAETQPVRFLLPPSSRALRMPTNLPTGRSSATTLLTMSVVVNSVESAMHKGMVTMALGSRPITVQMIITST